LTIHENDRGIQHSNRLPAISSYFLLIAVLLIEIDTIAYSGKIAADQPNSPALSESLLPDDHHGLIQVIGKRLCAMHSKKFIPDFLNAVPTTEDKVLAFMVDNKSVIVVCPGQVEFLIDQLDYFFTLIFDFSYHCCSSIRSLINARQRACGYSFSLKREISVDIS
jgi:hypothetical protein